MSDGYRMEQDSLGEVRVPTDALYGAQTQRAIENFPISGQRFGRGFIQALGLLKKAAALTIQELGNLDGSIAEAIATAWDVYKPQLRDYVTRALDPRSAPSYGVPGDE